MAADPTAKFEHIWHALMRALGTDHRKLYQRNKLYQSHLRPVRKNR